MKIIDYCSKGGKNLILNYIDNLDDKTYKRIVFIRNSIELYGLDAFEYIKYRKLIDKVYEIKVYDYRLAYTILYNKIYFLHIFKKQKNKTESNDIKLAYKRYKELL